MLYINEAVTERVRQLLKEKNITQYSLEQKTGLSHDTLKSIFKGKTKGVTLKTVILLADGFDLTVLEFLNSELFKYKNINI